MKILHLCWSGAIGGTENFVVDLACHQATRHEVTVGWLTGAAGRRPVPGVAFQSFHLRGGHDLRGLAALSRWVHDCSPDIVHNHESSPLAAWCNRRCPSARIVTHIHTVDRYESWIKRGVRSVERRMAERRTAHFIANSSSTKETVMRQRGLPAARISVVPNGIDLSRFQRAGSRESVRRALGLEVGAFVVGIVARLQRVKGVDYFLRVAAAVAERHPNTTFIVVGDGPERETLAALAHRLGIHNQVIFLGEREDAPDLVTGFDVFLSTSRAETFGISLLEAMASRVPVVAFAVGAVPEVLGGHGFLVAPGDVSEASRRVVDLCSDRTDTAQLVESAHAYVSARYDLPVVTRAVEQVYVRVRTRSPG